MKGLTWSSAMASPAEMPHKKPAKIAVTPK
jgi:hypothetical protein